MSCINFDLLPPTLLFKVFAGNYSGWAIAVNLSGLKTFVPFLTQVSIMDLKMAKSIAGHNVMNCPDILSFIFKFLIALSEV